MRRPDQLTCSMRLDCFFKSKQKGESKRSCNRKKKLRIAPDILIARKLTNFEKMEKKDT
jgi:hypothetical protein